MTATLGIQARLWSWAAIALLGCSASSFAADPGSPIVMEWTDLRSSGRTEVGAYRRLWKDKLDDAQRRWASTAPPGNPLPAFTLGHTFVSARPPVLVSILFNMYDCELPGNGTGADLYARCPMRVVTGMPGSVRIKTIERACHLYVPAITKPDDGPNPAQNYTTVTLDASRTLHVRVVQFGRPVPSCDGDYQVE